MAASTELVRIRVRDDLRRSRLTAGFRAILAIPHLIWLAAWGSVMLLLLPVMWVIVLVTRRPDEGLREVYVMYLRYTLHVYAYLFLAADPFPGFLGRGGYPVDLVAPPVAEQGRWGVVFRLVLALPPLVFAGALGSGMATGAGSAVSFGPGVAMAVAFLAWFACLARGRMPAGFRDVLVWALGYGVQTLAYAFLVTGRHPDSDPRAVPLVPRPPHPVRLSVSDDGRRSRLTVLFRWILLAPHAVWLLLWGTAVLVVLVPAWLAALVLGRLPVPLHRFVAAFVRYATHVNAFGYLAGGPFPGFTGRAGSYPVELEIAGPERQPRWSIAFRWLLALPAFMVAGALGTAMSLAAVGAWCWALVRGEMPRGLHAMLLYGLRYTAQVYAYACLLTPAYPHSGPAADRRRTPEGLELFGPPGSLFAAPRPGLVAA